MVVPVLVFFLSQSMVSGSTFTDKLLKERYLRCFFVYQVDIKCGESGRMVQWLESVFGQA